MTGMLQDLLRERADEAGVPHLDLEAITRDGEARVRHRRRAVLGGLAAASVSVVAGVALLNGGSGPGPDSVRDGVADGTDAAPAVLSWVEGSTLHRTGAPDVDLGVGVRAWVWAGDRVVFTDDDLRVRVWTGGVSEEVGSVAAPDPDDVELVADGTSVAWADPDEGLVRLDTASGARTSLGTAGLRDTRVTALDGDVVYAVDRGGVLSWDTRSQEVTVLDASGRDIVLDAEGGTLLQVDGRGQARVTGSGVDLPVTTDSFAALSPDAAYVVTESDDEGLLLATATGRRVALETGHEWSLPFQWLDDDTVAVLAFTGTGSGEDERAFLLPCSTSAGTCGDATDLPASFQLPLGVHLVE